MERREAERARTPKSFTNLRSINGTPLWLQPSIAEEGDKRKFQDFTFEDLVLPPMSDEDPPWELGVGLPQMMFVVDSQTVADVMNCLSACSNPEYTMAFERMMNRLAVCFGKGVVPPAGWRNFVQWRRRAYNTLADAASNLALKHRNGHNTLDHRSVSEAVADSRCALQFFSDGGHVPGYGSAHAFAVVLWTYDGSSWHRRVAGTAATFYAGRSAFEAEVLGLDAAISWAAQLRI